MPASGEPSARTDFPLLSISSCCKYDGNFTNDCSYGTIACVGRSKPLRFQCSIRPINTGMFAANGADTKCSSISCAPARNVRNPSGPIATINDKPIADHIEYRPPTQSQNSNMFSTSMPNSDTFSAFVDTATKCRATAASEPPSAPNTQSRAERAFVRVSNVVNVFDDTMNNVSAASNPCTASTRSAPSTLETNRNCISRREYGRKASYAIAGPRSEPPMPMFTTLRMGRPVWPSHDPERTASANADIFASTRCTSATTSTPSTINDEPAGIRSATCSTERSSVTLMCSPANIASRRAAKPTASASASSNPSVSSVTRCLA